jgi:hypothetical protein
MEDILPFALSVAATVAKSKRAVILTYWPLTSLREFTLNQARGAERARTCPTEGEGIENSCVVRCRTPG